MSLGGKRHYRIGEDCTVRKFIIFIMSTPPQYYSGDQIKNNEMGRACGTYGR